MCTAIYIAANKPLPLIQWEEGKSIFYTALVSGEPDVKVHKQFINSNTCYAGSYEGCGCGFHNFENEDFPGIFTEEELTISEKSRIEFKHYLDKLLEDNYEIEIFICWEGDQGERPEIIINITTEDILRKTFWIDEERKYCKLVSRNV
jgi:hypothetical protein